MTSAKKCVRSQSVVMVETKVRHILVSGECYMRNRDMTVSIRNCSHTWEERGMGLPTKEDRLSTGLTVPEIISLYRSGDELLGLQCRFGRNRVQSIHRRLFSKPHISFFNKVNVPSIWPATSTLLKNEMWGSEKRRRYVGRSL